MTEASYILYLLISSGIVLWVGNFCYQNGKLFIANYFPNHRDIGNRINRLLRIAYYLLNIGLAVFCLYSIKNIETLEMMMVELSRMLGFILLVIGVLHFNNILLISLLHKHFKT
jgi:hypothetical protein